MEFKIKEVISKDLDLRKIYEDDSFSTFRQKPYRALAEIESFQSEDRCLCQVLKCVDISKPSYQPKDEINLQRAKFLFDSDLDEDDNENDNTKKKTNKNCVCLIEITDGKTTKEAYELTEVFGQKKVQKNSKLILSHKPLVQENIILLTKENCHIF